MEGTLLELATLILFNGVSSGVSAHTATDKQEICFVDTSPRGDGVLFIFKILFMGILHSNMFNSEGNVPAFE